jgi:hypothetical protein
MDEILSYKLRGERFNFRNARRIVHDFNPFLGEPFVQDLAISHAHAHKNFDVLKYYFRLFLFVNIYILCTQMRFFFLLVYLVY